MAVATLTPKTTLLLHSTRPLRGSRKAHLIHHAAALHPLVSEFQIIFMLTACGVVLGLKKEVYNVSLSTVRSFLLPLEATMQVFRSGQATAACLHWQEDISKTERPNPGNWSRNGSPGLIIPDSFSGNKQGWTGRELNRILFCPACQRNSLASVPQPLVIITLASPHRK